MRNRILTGMALATLAAVLWAFTLAAALGLPAGFPTAEVLVGRYGVQLLLLTLLVLPFRGKSLGRTAKPKIQAVRGLMMLIMPIAFTLAVHRIGSSDAWAALWLGPVFGIGFARYVLDDSQPTGPFALALVATAGAILAHTPVSMPTPGGSVAVIGAAAAFGVFLALTRTLREESASTGLLWTAACVFFPSLLLLPMTWQPITARAAMALIVIGTLWLLVLLTIDEALRRAPLVLIAPFLLTEIVWARLLLRVHWTATAAMGGVAVLACAAWCVRLALTSGESLNFSRTGVAA